MHRNPLRDGLRLEPVPGPCTLIIFGASGDLTRRKLLPAVYQLARAHRLPPTFSIVGISKSPWTDDTFRDTFRESLREFAGAEAPEAAAAESLAHRLTYISGDLEDPGLYERLREALEPHAQGGFLFYLAIPPGLAPSVAEHLGRAGLSDERSPDAWRRIIVEKPFGSDLSSARELNRLLHTHFDESQIYRIDHYLGKETVQNLLVFRFANGMFEPIWNRRYIEHVQITAAETVGVEERAGYYETAGALRDMVQNHLLQLLTLVAMEPPVTFSAESVRDRKLDALLSIQPPGPASGTDMSIVRAQYRDGWVDGREVRGYRAEPRVNPQSVTETFVAMRLLLDSWRWAGVPFYVRTGKRLPKRVTEIAIQFHRPPLEIFRKVSASPVSPNLLVINVQPDEGISLRFEAKLPGSRMQVAPVMMTFRYGAVFGGGIPEAYETLLLDALVGDSTLFARHDFVEHAWALISPVHEAWREQQVTEIPTYEAGEWGPPEADALAAARGHRWRTL